MLEEVDEVHRDLTRRFVAALALTVLGAVIGLGVFALSYATPSGHGSVVEYVVVVISVGVAVVGIVFSAVYAHRIGRLKRRR